MRHDQPDESDHAGDGGRERGQHRRERDQLPARLAHVDAETLRALLAQADEIERPCERQEEQAASHDRRRADDDVLERAALQSAHEPEEDLTTQLEPAGADRQEERGAGVEERVQRDAREQQPFRSRAMPRKRHHRRGGEAGAHDGRQRHGPQSVAQSEGKHANRA